MKRTQLYYFAKGHLGQYEDWWYLVENDDGTKHVDHDWDHVSVNGLSKSQGTNNYSIDQALLNAPQGAITKLKEIIGPQLT